MNLKNFCKKVSFIGIFTLFFLIVFLSNSSSIMLGLSTEKLTKNSDLVVEGEVEDTISEWSKNGKTIITSANIIVSNVIKGVMPYYKIIVEYEGGLIGDLGMRVSDEVQLSKGERVIIFLKEGKSKKDGTVFKIVGKSQGKYVIDNNGVARKQGFSLVQGKEFIDNDIPVEELVEKIRRVE